MSGITEIHVGDWGTEFIATIKEAGAAIPLQSVSATHIVFKTPVLDILEKDAVFVTDGSDGQIKYVTVDGDLDIEGTWQWQARITFSTGEWTSDVKTFKVVAILVDENPTP